MRFNKLSQIPYSALYVSGASQTPKTCWASCTSCARRIRPPWMAEVQKMQEQFSVRTSTSRLLRIHAPAGYYNHIPALAHPCARRILQPHPGSCASMRPPDTVHPHPGSCASMRPPDTVHPVHKKRGLSPFLTACLSCCYMPRRSANRSAGM